MLGVFPGLWSQWSQGNQPGCVASLKNWTFLIVESPIFSVAGERIVDGVEMAADSIFLEWSWDLQMMADGTFRVSAGQVSKRGRGGACERVLNGASDLLLTVCVLVFCV